MVSPVSNVHNPVTATPQYINGTLGESVTVGTSLTKIADFQGGGLVEIEVATTNLNAFEIRGVTDGGEQTLYSTAADYSSPSGILVGTSGDLTTLAVGTGWFIIDPTVQNITLYASVAAGTAGVTVNG